ncbi:macrolide 2'-phosphotransferase [Mycetocola tolaasinivorans]|uniref:Macrolide 2'-phosphotransferase n=1 Tax=Mycetocola tolaasinivorans TaxID=76635 RepID=A0A3L7A7W1_9MICO|nr:phosphotransferase [Mycetocola tolaasinivorans]RLP76466.1 macrolide 2'-phosphotransferase [Mycetocola tolaasinivorans]
MATAAVPGLAVRASGPLQLDGTGDFDSALLRTATDEDLVIRIPNTERAAGEQAIELIALQAMTAGIRSRLPFEVPTVVGQAANAPGRIVVSRYLPGFQVPAAYIPPGDGVATSIGGAIAAIHTLPASFVTEIGLPALTAAQCRNEALNVIERAASTRRLPAAIRQRWSDAANDDMLWQFQPVVVNGTLSAESFLITDHEVGPVVSGLIGWSGLRVSDPARDLHWLSAAPEAADDVFAAYRLACTRTPDRFIRQRALLHAELELARWLLHGLDTRNQEIVEDAVGLLDGLVDSVLGNLSEPINPATDPVLAVADVETLLTRTPKTVPSDAQIGMETDTYDFDEEEPVREETGPVPTLSDPESASETDGDAGAETDAPVRPEDEETREITPVDSNPDTQR